MRGLYKLIIRALPICPGSSGVLQGWALSLHHQTFSMQKATENSLIKPGDVSPAEIRGWRPEPPTELHQLVLEGRAHVKIRLPASVWM